jgi:O-antigen biosynthesis protein
MQPVAGRLKHGLTPWRKRGAGFNIKYLFTSRRSNLTYWSEKWHSTEEWLTGIEKNLIGLKARVKRGGEFDAWDLHARNDLFSTSRCSLLIEEHGSGKQLVRLKYRLQIAPFAIAACLSGLVLSAFSWQDQNWLVTGILLVCSLLIFFRITKGYTNSRFTLYQAFKNLESQKRNQDFDTDSNPVLNETIWSVEKKSMALNN